MLNTVVVPSRSARGSSGTTLRLRRLRREHRTVCCREGRSGPRDRRPQLTAKVRRVRHGASLPGAPLETETAPLETETAPPALQLPASKRGEIRLCRTSRVRSRGAVPQLNIESFTDAAELDRLTHLRGCLPSVAPGLDGTWSPGRSVTYHMHTASEAARKHRALKMLHGPV